MLNQSSNGNNSPNPLSEDERSEEDDDCDLELSTPEESLSFQSRGPKNSRNHFRRRNQQEVITEKMMEMMKVGGELNMEFLGRRVKKKKVDFGAIAFSVKKFADKKEEKMTKRTKIEVKALPVPTQRALGCLELDNPVRRVIRIIVKNKWFDRVILVLIIINSVFLVLDDGRATGDEAVMFWWVELIFTFAFSIEMFFKIIAFGLIMTPTCYLRDSWNRLDFIVVLLSWMNYMGFQSGVGAIRTLRVLRPLRAVKNIKGMRIIISALLMSLPYLVDVCTLFGFLCFVFGILGVQLFGGKLSNRCHSLSTGAPLLDMHTGRTILCGLEGVGYQCGAGNFCAKFKENPLSGTLSFDNIPRAWIVILQCISLEGWADVMYAICGVDSMWSQLYFVALIMFGSFFIINLVTAVVFLRFSQIKLMEDENSMHVALFQTKELLWATLKFKKSKNPHKQWGEESSTLSSHFGSKFSQPSRQDSILDEGTRKFGRAPSMFSGGHRTIVTESGKRKTVGAVKAEIELHHQMSDLDLDNINDASRILSEREADLHKPSTRLVKRSLRRVASINVHAMPVDKSVIMGSSPKQKVSGSGSPSKHASISPNSSPDRRAMKSSPKSSGRKKMDMPPPLNLDQFKPPAKVLSSRLQQLKEEENQLEQDDKRIQTKVSELQQQLTDRQSFSSSDRENQDTYAHESFCNGKCGNVCRDKALPDHFSNPPPSLSGTARRTKRGSPATWANPPMPPAAVSKKKAPSKNAVYPANQASFSDTSGESPHSRSCVTIEKRTDSPDPSPPPPPPPKPQAPLPPMELETTNASTNEPLPTAAPLSPMHASTNEPLPTAAPLSPMLPLSPVKGVRKLSSSFQMEERESNSSGPLAPLLAGHANREDNFEKQNQYPIFSPGQNSQSPVLGPMNTFERHRQNSVDSRLRYGSQKSLESHHSHHSSQWHHNTEMYSDESDDDEEDMYKQKELPVFFRGGLVRPSTLPGYQRKYLVPLYSFTLGKYFTNFVILCIIFNTVVMAIDYNGIEQYTTLVSVLEGINLFFFSVFLLEMVLKLIALTPILYIKSYWNLFDGVVVLISSIEIMSGSGGGAISVLRSFRLLRVLRILNFSKGLKSLLGTILLSIKDLGYFMMVLFLILFIYAVLGMQLFAFTMYDEDGEIARAHFDDFGWAMVTVFQITTAENWNEVMYSATQFHGPLASLYFISLLVIGNYMLLSLFLAIMLGNFDQQDNSMYDQKPKNKKSCCRRCCIGMLRPCLGKDTKIERLYSKGGRLKERESCVILDMNKEAMKRKQSVITLSDGTFHIQTEGKERLSRHSLKENKVHNKIILRGRSWKLFSKHNPFRKKVAIIVSSEIFDRFIILMIIVGCTLLCFDTYDLDPDSESAYIMQQIDLVLTIVFTLEFVLKSIAFQFMVGKGSYLQNSWNQLDFAIVLSSLLDLAIGNLNIFRTFRILKILRSLRALRMLSHLQRLQLVVRSLFATLQALANVGMIGALFTTIFAILGVQLFKGQMFRCQTSAIDALYGVSKAECDVLQAAGEPVAWKSSAWNFDNFPHAFLVLFEISSLEMWPRIMYEVIDHTGTAPDEGPVRDSNQAVAGFFILYILIGSLFVVGLFVGVVVDQYNRQYQKFTGVLSLSQEQEHYLQTYKDMVYQPPELPLLPLKRGCFKGRWGERELTFRHLMYKAALSKVLESIIIVSIVLNVVAMAMSFVGQSEEYEMALNIVNDIFSWVFILEAIIKITGLGWRQYTSSNWNLFDAFLIIISIATMIINGIGAASLGVDPSFFRVFRIFRILRIFRLVRRLKGLNALIQTLVFSFPALYNVGTLLFLLYFMFAVMGMNLFGGTEQKGLFITPLANFDTFGVALITLFRLSTGENWNGVMHELWDNTQTGFDSFMCLFFFAAFQFMSNFLLINVFVAVVLKNFEEEVMSDNANTNNPLTREDVITFGKLWVKDFVTYDIDYKQCDKFIRKLPAPWGIQYKDMRSTGKYLRVMRKMDIPVTDDGKVHCLDVCLALCLYRVFYSKIDTKESFEHGIGQDNEMLRASKIQAFRAYPELKKRKKFRISVDEILAAVILQHFWREYDKKTTREQKLQKKIDRKLYELAAIRRELAEVQAQTKKQKELEMKKHKELEQKNEMTHKHDKDETLKKKQVKISEEHDKKS